MIISLTGFEFIPGESQKCIPEGEVLFLHEKANKYDANCVSVWWGDHMIGHLKKGSPEQKLAVEKKITTGKIVKVGYAVITPIEGQRSHFDFLPEGDYSRGQLAMVHVEIDDRLIAYEETMQELDQLCEKQPDFRDDTNNFYVKDGIKHLRITKFLELVKDKYSTFDSGLDDDGLNLRADYGNVIHDMAADLAFTYNQFRQMDAWGCMSGNGVWNMLVDNGIVDIITEKEASLTVYSKSLRIAGTVDAVGEMDDEDGKIVIDWKNSMSKKHVFQICFNAMGHKATNS